MIVNGSSRSNGAFFARHLMRTDQNERVSIVEMRGLGHAEDVAEAFALMKARAVGTGCKNYFYHANINTLADEELTPEQWAQARETLARHLGLEGQPCFAVQHLKEDGRTHQHVVWSRIDSDTMTTIHDGHNYRRHEDAAREIEEAFNLKPVERCLTRDKEAMPRQERRPQDWESFRAQESKIDPQAMKAELTDLWQRSDSGPAFAAALEAQGYILARGDRRDFVVVDAAGDEHSLGRRISGVKAAEIRSRLEDVDREALPSVEEARALARQRQDADTGSAPASAAQEKPEDAPAPSLFDTIKAELAKDAQAQPMPVADKEPTPAASLFAEARERCAEEAAAAPQMPEEQGETSASRYDRFRAWCGTMRGYVEGFGQQVREYWGGWFGAREPEAEPEPPPQGTPDNTVTAPTLDADRNRQQGMEPSL